MRHDPAPLFDDKTIVTLLAAGAALALVAAALPAAAALLYAGQLPDMSLAEAAAGTVRIAAQGRFADPAAAYPAAAQAQLPAAAGFYAAALWLAVTVAAAAVGGWRQLDRLRARAWLGRRPYDPRGARPRGWARPRDLAELVVAGPERDRFTVGRLDRRRLATDDQAHVVVCAPPRTGKTTRCVIPWLLEHDGPAIVTSTRRDVLDASEGWRRRLGRVWIWDPFTPGSARWTPLERCQSWEHALQQAQWLADAAEDGDSDVARFWRGEAAKLLAPLLHAAALERGSMGELLRWLDTHDAAAPAAALERAGALTAGRQLEGVAGLDARNRGTTYMSAAALLAAYRHPSVLAAEPHLEAADGEPLTAGALLDGRANTLYIVASERRQRLLAPLIVAIVSSLLNEAAERANAGRRTSPTLRLLIDEAANIAPLRELPRHVSEAAGNGVRIATVWQSLAQLRQRYGDAADTILAGSTAKLFMGPVSDETTRRYLASSLGDEPVTTRSSTSGGGHTSRTEGLSWRPRAAADALQQLGGERAVLFNGALPPTVVRLLPWWQDGELKRRAALQAAA